MIRLHRAGEGWAQDVQSTELRPIFHDDLVADWRRPAFANFCFYGSYDRSAFEPNRSGDLIAVPDRRPAVSSCL